MSSSCSDTPFLSDVSGLTRGSHKKVQARCQLNISDKCNNVVEQEYRSIRNVMDRNDGKYICMFCSRKNKFSGRNNPNCKYKNLDDNFFSTIDTEFKAYLLGWIASDGHVSANNDIRIEINIRDEEILKTLRNGICPDIPMVYRNNGSTDLIGFCICSKKICEDVCSYLQINPGKKSDTVQLPKLSEELTWTFIRGLFDGDGSVRKLTKIEPRRECSLASNSSLMLNQLAEFCKIKYYISGINLGFSGTNTIDFLSKIYDTADPKLRMERKYNLYLECLNFAPGLYGLYGSVPRCKFVKTDKRAISPSKGNASDEGYDLWLIDIDKKISKNIIRFETGIKIQPDDDWHAEIMPRSSLSNTGWMLANSIGLIDCSYRGTLKVCLIKVDPEAKDIELPFKGVQMVFRRNIHFICDEEEELDDTARNEGGFGSTDKK